MKLNIILTGATGMVGEGVLHECLNHPDVESVLSISRKPYGATHPKLKEIILTDFFAIDSIKDQLSNYNTCFFCSGVSSVGKIKDEFYKLTYLLTMNFAQVVSSVNSDMTFCYISGSGTDTTEKGRINWARVKGKTENDLQKLPFKKVYAFRPGMLRPTEGLKNTLSYYKYFGWLYPVIRACGGASTLRELGLAMINVSLRGYDKSVLEIKDIIAMGK